MSTSAQTTAPVAETALSVEGVRVSRWPHRYTVVALCFAATFVCYIDRVNISVAALSMQERFAWSETTKGLVLSSFFVGYLLLQIPAGYLSGRYGGKIILGIAVLWWSVCTFLTPMAATVSLPVLIVARVAMGAGEAATFPAAYSLFARWVPTAERSRVVSLMLSGIPLGTLFAVSVSGWIIVGHGWPAVFYLFGALGLVWSVLWFSLVQKGPHTISDRKRQHATRVPLRLLLSKPPVWALVINHFCSNWSLYMLMAWLPSYFRTTLGLSIAQAGLAAAAPWLSMLVMSNVAAWIADRAINRGASVTFVRRFMQITGLLGSAVFLLIARDVTDPGTAQSVMCGALGFLAFTWSGFSPNHLDIAPRQASVLMGITNTAGTIPGVIGVAVTGWLVDTTGSYASPFLLAAGISGMGALVWLLFASGRPVLE
jgi:ACS family sodium-dependent inorganic phosphate cotransporter